MVVPTVWLVFLPDFQLFGSSSTSKSAQRQYCHPKLNERSRHIGTLFEKKEAPGVPSNDVQEVTNYVALFLHYKLTNVIPRLSLQVKPASDARKTIRERGHIVLTNPDMLHSGILPHHTKWIRLFENLR